MGRCHSPRPPAKLFPNPLSRISPSLQNRQMAVLHRGETDPQALSGREIGRSEQGKVPAQTSERRRWTAVELDTIRTPPAQSGKEAAVLAGRSSRVERSAAEAGQHAGRVWGEGDPEKEAVALLRTGAKKKNKLQGGQKSATGSLGLQDPSMRQASAHQPAEHQRFRLNSDNVVATKIDKGKDKGGPPGSNNHQSDSLMETAIKSAHGSNGLTPERIIDTSAAVWADQPMDMGKIAGPVNRRPRAMQEGREGMTKGSVVPVWLKPSREELEEVVQRQVSEPTCHADMVILVTVTSCFRPLLYEMKKIMRIGCSFNIIPHRVLGLFNGCAHKLASSGCHSLIATERATFGPSGPHELRTE